MYSYKLFDIYPRNQNYAKNFQKKIPWLISKKVYPLTSKFSIRVIITSGRSKYGVVNKFTPPSDNDPTQTGSTMSIKDHCINFDLQFCGKPNCA